MEMTFPERNQSAYLIDEVEVSMTIKDGKFTATSTSGPKAGKVKFEPNGNSVDLEFEGAGSDRAVVRLSRPELTQLRTTIDALLANEFSDGDRANTDQRGTFYSGYRRLREFDDDIGVTLDTETLRSLGLVDEQGSLSGGSRQVQCTVLRSGVAILNLQPDGSSRLFDAF
jgi:hypothetical protein